MNFPLKNSHSKKDCECLSISLFLDKRRSEYIGGFYTGRHLQCTLKDGSTPYSLAHGNIKILAFLFNCLIVNDEGWLVGDECGRVWVRDDYGTDTVTEDPFQNVAKLQSAVSEISPLNRSKVLFGEMRGNVTLIDFNNLCEETVVSFEGLVEKAPVKCIRWQPAHEEIFAIASQSKYVQFADLRCLDKLIGLMNGVHSSNSQTSATRSTVTGLVFHPSRPELFYTCGTPDNSVKLWDMRKLSDYTAISRAPVKKTRKSTSNVLTPVEEFSTSSYTAKKHRSSVSLTIDSIGSRLFLATSNDK